MTTYLRDILFGLILSSLTGASCLSGGCVMDARQLAGYSNPSVEVRHGIFGTTVKVGTNAGIKASGRYNTKTGDASFEVDANSDVSGVVSAEGARITQEFIQLRKDEAARVVEQHRIAGETIKAVASTVMGALAAGKPEVANGFVNSIGPALVPMMNALSPPDVAAVTKMLEAAQPKPTEAGP